MAVKTYSLKAHGKVKLSENFSVKEFKCNDGNDKVLIDEKLPELLQKMRDKYGKISITSAYRTEAYNSKVGGSPRSQHLYGTAADVVIKGCKDLEEAAEYAKNIGFSGVGLNAYKKFLHLDTRTNKSYFRYNSNGSTYSATAFVEKQPTLKKGAKGEAVKCLQTKLKKLGFCDHKGKTLTVDGVFGTGTEHALRTFQKAKGLTADGICGTKTWAKLG